MKNLILNAIIYFFAGVGISSTVLFLRERNRKRVTDDCIGTECEEGEPLRWWKRMGRWACRCPVCKQDADDFYNYCPHCGQKLDKPENINE